MAIKISETRTGEMSNIIFTKPDGSEHNVTVENGVTVMEAGRDAGLGIEGTCGGCLSCACLLYTSPSPRD